MYYYFLIGNFHKIFLLIDFFRIKEIFSNILLIDFNFKWTFIQKLSLVPANVTREALLVPNSPLV
jgi:hypothetical protein